MSPSRITSRCRRRQTTPAVSEAPRRASLPREGWLTSRCRERHTRAGPARLHSAPCHILRQGESRQEQPHVLQATSRLCGIPLQRGDRSPGQRPMRTRYRTVVKSSEFAPVNLAYPPSYYSVASVRRARRVTRGTILDRDSRNGLTARRFYPKGADNIPGRLRATENAPLRAIAKSEWSCATRGRSHDRVVGADLRSGYLP